MRRPPSAFGSLAAAAALFCLGSCTALFAPDRSARAPVLEGFGSLEMPLVSAVPAAQQLFARGMLQSYAFNDAEADRAFKAALAQDPDCAMCAWGVAKAAGPNINDPERHDLADARRHLAWAAGRVAPAAQRERALIEALSERYGPEAGTAKVAVPEMPICSSGGGPKAHPLDIVYAARMRALADAWPDDPDILVMYAEAVLIATRDDWWDKKTGQPAGEIGLVTDRLERALATRPGHTGLNHFLIHAADSSPRPERASAAADRLGALAPASPHLLHMPAHIYVRVGRYPDAVRVNEAAVAAQARQKAALAAQGFSQSVDWDGHNRDFLWFAALTEGRGELALAQARALAERAAQGKSPSAEFFRGLPLLTLVRLERWSEVLEEPVPGGAAGLAAPMADYARGVALVRTGRLDAARERSASLLAALGQPVLKGATVMGDDSAAKVLEILSSRLVAEIAAADGQADASRAALARGIELEAALEATEPPLLASTSRLALGGLMLRLQRWSDAERAYRDELVAQPASGWALAGLEQALAGQGRTEDARRSRAEAERAWAAADPSVRRIAMR
ncbi:MAG: hypothetical protein K8R60_02435 [Burkholderiales bacterium]|nr:hypothetical protein [Burkholderiales bacterium]